MDEARGTDRAADHGITRVAVLGVGTMGSTISWLLARAGIEVVVTDTGEEAILDGLERIAARARMEAAADPKDSARDLEALLASNVSSAVDIERAVRDVDLVIEATTEDREVKAAVLGRTAASVRPDCIIASNTSSIPIEILASNVPPASSGRVIGVHFFNPADLVPGVEVITHPGTEPDVIEACLALMRAVGKRPALVRSSPGFVANRLQIALFREAALCIEEGVATAAEIDRIVSNTFGHRLPAFGPLRVADMAGLDVYRGIFEVLEEAFGPRFSPPRSFLELTDRGHLGTKTGHGYHDYADGEVERLTARRDRAYRGIAGALETLEGSDPG